MITAALLNVIFAAIYGICYLMPDAAYSLPNWSVSAMKLISTGLKIFPTDVWVAVVANALFWIMLHFTWAVIEWVYKKIPGVD